MTEEITEQQPAVTEVAPQVERQEEADILGIIVVYILSVLAPTIGLAVGAALRLTGSAPVKRVGTICMIIGLVSFVLGVVLVLAVAVGMGMLVTAGISAVARQ